MTKEKEAEKILLVMDKVILHIITSYESVLRKDKEALEYELQEMTKQESKREAVDHQKSNNVNQYIIAWEKIKASRIFAKLMFDALNIEDPFDVNYKKMLQKEAEALDKLLSKQFDEEAELEKLID